MCTVFADLSAAISLSTTAFAVTDPQEAQFVRSQIAFYASTPSYRGVMELHGWEETAERLQGMARRGEWPAMGGLITEEMLEAFAVVCEPEVLGSALLERYQGLVDRLALYLPYVPGQRDPMWSSLVRSLRAIV